MCPKSAWLIGLYTTDIDDRVSDLGYSIERIFSNEDIPLHLEAPELIVFADAFDNDCNRMEAISKQFPSSLIISLPVNRFFLEELVYSGDRSAKRSVARLTSDIREREHRWEN